MALVTFGLTIAGPAHRDVEFFFAMMGRCEGCDFDCRIVQIGIPQ